MHGEYVNPTMAKKNGDQTSPNILDYPSGMPEYERENLAAEAKLAAERKTKKRPKPAIRNEYSIQIGHS
jgi:hypothetical protein